MESLKRNNYSESRTWWELNSRPDFLSAECVGWRSVIKKLTPAHY